MDEPEGGAGVAPESLAASRVAASAVGDVCASVEVAGVGVLGVPEGNGCVTGPREAKLTTCAQALCAAMANTWFRRTTASAPSATIAKIPQTTKAERPGREAGVAGSVRMFFTGRRPADRAIGTAPAAGLIGGAGRRTVAAGWPLSFARGICGAREALGPKRSFAFTLSTSLRNASIDG